VGVAAAFGGVDLLVGLYGGTLSRAEGIELNGVVLAFSLTLSVLVGLAMGIAPTLRATPSRVSHALRDGTRGSSLRGSGLGRALVVIQVALALVLVVGAGLLTKSMWRLQEIDLGLVDIDHMLTFQLTLPEAKYETGQPVVGFYETLATNLESLPGIEGVGFVNRLPLLGGFNARLSVWGEPERTLDFVSMRPVTRGYFDALGMRLVSGRLPTEGEYTDGTPVAVVNETLARRLFAGEDPVGRGITDWVEGGLPIVGVVGDVRGAGPTRPAPPALYFPFAAFGGVQAASGIVKTTGEPGPFAARIREAVRTMDPAIPAYRIRTMRELVLERFGNRRFARSLFGVFAGLALLLGSVGIYGVMSYSVAQRSRELGVRMALGAGRSKVMRMVLREGIGLVGPGVAIGLVLSLGAARLLGDLLFEVSAVDPGTYLVVALVLVVVAVGATLGPALRATGTDPLRSMRTE
jgi:putative ABC transport system permease protein